MITRTTHAIVEDIINKFNFDLVHAYMVVNNWTWRNEKKSPNMVDLEFTARSLLIEVIEQSKKSNNEYTFSSTGGFKASYYKGCNQFFLEFIIVGKYTNAN